MEPFKAISRAAEGLNTWTLSLLSLKAVKKTTSNLQKQRQITMILKYLIVALGYLG